MVKFMLMLQKNGLLAAEQTESETTRRRRGEEEEEEEEEEEQQQQHFDLKATTVPSLFPTPSTCIPCGVPPKRQWRDRVYRAEPKYSKNSFLYLWF